MIKNRREKSSKLSIEKRAFINGSFVESVKGKIINKISPVDGRNLSGLCACSRKDVNHAVNVARRSFGSKIWRGKTTAEKKEILFTLADLMEKNR
jgi:acyl-CoA reductase-like NAD-dependent aldehyde dehydrogenase